MELFQGNTTGLCPVSALEQFSLVRPHLGGPLFVHADGSCLSRFQFVVVFCKCLLEAGPDPLEYTSHSLLIGAATEASRRGLNDNAVKQIGRWESKRFRMYVRPQLL